MHSIECKRSQTNDSPAAQVVNFKIATGKLLQPDPEFDNGESIKVDSTNQARIRKVKNRAICYILAFAIILLPARSAKADGPFCAGFGLVSGAVVLFATGFAIGVEVGKALYNGDRQTKKGSSGSGGKTVSPGSSNSIAIITVPDDLQPPLSIDPGFVLSEVDTFGSLNTNQALVSYSNIDYTCNVLNSNYQALYPGQAVASYDMIRSNSFSFLRSASNSAGSVTVSISLPDLLLGTTNVPGTMGTSGMEFTLECEQQGILLHSAAWALQAALPKISGDIPASAFTPSLGYLGLNNYSNQITVVAASNVNELDFTVVFRTWGVGRTNIAPAPVITQAEISGGNLIFIGTNGSPILPYAVLTATNPVLPVADWAVLATSAFDTNGAFAFTTALRQNVPQTYYRLQAF